MAIKRYIPTGDAFILDGPGGRNVNTGDDEILELGKSTKIGTEGSSRILLKFSSIALPEIPYSALLHLSLAEAQYLPSEFSIEAFPVSEPWDEGLGRLRNRVAHRSGVTWIDRTLTESWTNPGGDYISGVSVQQTFDKHSSKDININVTDLFAESASLDNGILLKLQDESLATNLNTRLAYFGIDTHTIYRPYLEIGYDDSVYDSKLCSVDISQAYINIKNIEQNYTCSDSIRFEVGARPKYPVRRYSTCSLYAENYILPQTSYWGIRDEYTCDMVVPFSEYTKISADCEGSFFNVDMSILEPERYYRLLIKTEDNGGSVIVDDKSIFRVNRNGRY